MKNYLQISMLSLLPAASFYFMKMYQFAWGNVEVLGNGATINDIWYFTCESLANAFLFSSMGFFSTFLCALFPKNKTLFVIKYVICYGALFAWVRCLFNTITYEVVGAMEVLIDIILLIYLIIKSIKYRNRHEKSPYRGIAKYHRPA